ncbi:MAG: hypothetical protein EU535_01810 [Promethearchaeota archaeon]|nr:MAG: hypothetical protein EU535_01810 [Candidatus Lokiarchaeota archaeon]
MSNRSFDYFEQMFDIARIKVDDEHRGSVLPREYVGNLINQSIGKLLKFVENSNDDLAYCV